MVLQLTGPRWTVLLFSTLSATIRVGPPAVKGTAGSVPNAALQLSTRSVGRTQRGSLVPDRESIEEAETLALALEFGNCSLSDVRDWLYAKLEALPKPPPALLDLAGRPDLTPSEAISALRAFSGRPRDRVMLRRLLATLGAALRADPSRAYATGRILYGIAIDDEWHDYTQDILGELYSFDDALELAERGIFGDSASVVEEMQAFLDREGAGP